MKEGIHPEYRPVVYKDGSTGYTFLTRSTSESDRTIEWEDGNEYPLITLDISSSSHPFYTGTQRLVDSAGRVERFKKRYQAEKKPTSATQTSLVVDERFISNTGNQLTVASGILTWDHLG